MSLSLHPAVCDDARPQSAMINSLVNRHTLSMAKAEYPFP